MLIWWSLVALFVVAALVLRFTLPRFREGRRVKRILQGTQVKQQRYFDPMRSKKEGEHFLWGNKFLDEDQASLHFLAVGSTGSGKSININLLMKSVFARMNEEGSGIRALVYDSKSDLLSKIRGMGVAEEDILITNPFDQRRIAWDISKDIRAKHHAEDLSAVLVPDGESKDSFFNISGQNLTSGVVQAFQHNAEGNWTLRDLILASRRSDYLKAIFASCKYTEDISEEFKASKTAENMRQTMNNNLKKLESTAASWEGAKKKFVIKDWMTSQKVLVLGNSSKGKDPIKRINALLFTQVSKELLEVPGEAKAKYWFFLDELRELGHLSQLPDNLIVGRSKGLSIVLGFQDVHGVYQVYGKEVAQEMMGSCQNFALLRINPTTPETQQWAASVAGQIKCEIDKRGKTIGKDGDVSINISPEETTESIFIPSYFSQTLKEIKLSGEMRGLYYTKGKLYEQPYANEILFTDKGKTNRVPESVKGFENLEPIDDKELLLEPWNESDFKRLGFHPGKTKLDQKNKSASGPDFADAKDFN